MPSDRLFPRLPRSLVRIVRRDLCEATRGREAKFRLGPALAAARGWTAAPATVEDVKGEARRPMAVPTLSQRVWQRIWPQSWKERSAGVLAVFAVLGLPVLLAGCDGADAAGPPAPASAANTTAPNTTPAGPAANGAPKGRPVLVETVRFEPRVAARTFVAVIRPRIESDLGFRVPGKVARRLVEVGQVVDAGQPLAVLDDADLRLQRDQADAERTAAAASLAQAEAELRRVSELRREGWSTASALDRQRAAVEESRGRLTRAERAGTLAANASTYATLRSDTAGVVAATLVEPGQVVAAGQPAVRVSRMDEKEAVVALPEAFVERVRSGEAAPATARPSAAMPAPAPPAALEATMTLWSHPDRPYAVRLRELAPVADAATRTYQARFAVPEAGTEVKLGMSATVTLREAAGEQVARLPLSALHNDGSGPGVWTVLADGSLQRKPVAVAAYEARDVLLRPGSEAGLQAGDRVVVLGVQKLDASQRVRVVTQLAF